MRFLTNCAEIDQVASFSLKLTALRLRNVTLGSSVTLAFLLRFNKTGKGQRRCINFLPFMRAPATVLAFLLDCYTSPLVPKKKEKGGRKNSVHYRCTLSACSEVVRNVKQSGLMLMLCNESIELQQLRLLHNASTHSITTHVIYWHYTSVATSTGYLYSDVFPLIFRAPNTLVFLKVRYVSSQRNASLSSAWRLKRLADDKLMLR